MAIRYESGSTYFPGYETTDSVIEYLEADEIARRSLKNRRELVMLDQPSVAAVGKILAKRVRKPDVWIRVAVTTLDRFSREVCDGDLASALNAGKADPLVAEMLIQRYLSLHEDLTSVQISSLLFGPKLWWRINGVNVPWSPSKVVGKRSHIANSTKQDFNPQARLLMLSLIGTGLTFEEVASIKVKDAGSLDSKGNLLPNLQSDPLALEFESDEGRRITFLGEEARAALAHEIASRKPQSEDLLFADKAEIQSLKLIADKRGKAIIETVSQVNMDLCRTVGDFFREWGIPGSNFYKENGVERNS